MNEPSSGTAGRLLLAADTPVTCPACDASFSLEQGFARQALEHLQRASRGSLGEMTQQARSDAQRQASTAAAERQRLSEQQIAQLQELMKQQNATHAKALHDVRSMAEQNFAPQLAALQAELDRSREQVNVFATRESNLSQREREIEQRINESATALAQELFSVDRQALQQRLDEQAGQLTALRSQELQLRRAKSELEDRAAQMELEVARRLDNERAQIEGKARAQEKERSDLEKAELQKKLEDVNQKLTEAQQKSAQGSQQLQGEVLELALEDQLRHTFPVDSFAEVRKGARGADLVQRVMTRGLQQAGTLLWEAKRARDWSRDWPVKLKEDVRAAGADIGILVTTAMPPALSDQLFGLHEDVWVTTWGAAVALAAALRERVLEVHKQRAASSGKDEKMEALYDYLTSPQFAHKLKAVFGAFQALQEDLQKERSAAEQRWARREKQIATGMRELLGFAGDVQGLSQQALPQLELQGEPQP